MFEKFENEKKCPEIMLLNSLSSALDLLKNH